MSKDLYERFTDRARKVMILARQEAQRFGHPSIGTEHVLLGLSKDGSGVAANVLLNLGIDLRSIRLEVESRHGGESLEFEVPDPNLPIQEGVSHVIQNCMGIARELNHNYVGTEHILLSILRDKSCMGAEIITVLSKYPDVDVEKEVLFLLGDNREEWHDREKKRASETPENSKLQEITHALLKHYAGLQTAEQTLQAIRLLV